MKQSGVSLLKTYEQPCQTRLSALPPAHQESDRTNFHRVRAKTTKEPEPEGHLQQKHLSVWTRVVPSTGSVMSPNVSNLRREGTWGRSRPIFSNPVYLMSSKVRREGAPNIKWILFLPSLSLSQILEGETVKCYLLNAACGRTQWQTSAA